MSQFTEREAFAIFEGKAFLTKVVRAVKKNRFGEDTFW